MGCRGWCSGEILGVAPRTSAWTDSSAWDLLRSVRSALVQIVLRAIPKGCAWYPGQVKVICFESYSPFWKCSVQICACQESSARVLRGPRLAPLLVAKQTVTLILGLSSEAREKAGLFFVLTRCVTACPLGEFSPGNFPFPGFHLLWGKHIPPVGLCVPPASWALRGKARVGLRPWDVPEPPGRLRAGGFLRGSLRILHLRAFPARHRNDSFWASPPGRCSETDEWV